MSKFVLIKEIPKELRKGEYLIEMPTFEEEVKETIRSLGRGKTLTANYLRVVADAIGKKYDNTFNAFRNIIVHNFEGRTFENTLDIAKVVFRMFESQYPKIFEKYVETKLKERPYGTKLIYFKGPFLITNVFYKAGIDEIKEKDILTYLGLKPKKIVGKPAITNEETISTTINKKS
jgi:hypothetical protein